MQARGNTVPKHNGKLKFKTMARPKKVKEVQEIQEVKTAVIETEPTAPVTELPDTETDFVAEVDEVGKYANVEVKPGRVLLEELNTGKAIPPFIIVNALKVKQHADGTATVNGFIRNGKSILYKVIKKKV